MSDTTEKKDRPKVSVGLPVYNGANYLELAIQSILDQTFQDFELVICDNASTDNTEEICRRYAASDDRITYFRQSENLGASANFRSAFELSSGTYFKWHGHDDLLKPTYLQRLVEVLDDDPGCVLVYPRSVMIDDVGNEKWCFLEYLDGTSEEPAERLRQWLIPARHTYTHPVFGLVRSEVMARTDLLAPFLASDRAFLTHISLLGRSRMAPECLFRRRLHDNLSTSMYHGRDLRAWFDGKRPLLLFKEWRLLTEYLALINKTPIGFRSRIKCYRVMASWIRSNSVRLLAELMLPLYMNNRPTPLGRRLRSSLSLGRRT